MANNGRSGKRSLAKKVTSFVLYVDQVSQIQAIIEATGAEKDAQVFRDLIDEALSARRRKTAQQLTLPEQPPPNQSVEALETIQALLLKLIQQGEKARCVRGISLELLQEILAEARAGRLNCWENLAMPALRENGKSAREVASLFEGHTGKGKNFAYELAEEIRDQLEAAASHSTSDDVNREAQLVDDHREPPETGKQDAS
jgi:hypothetical protein